MSQNANSIDVIRQLVPILGAILHIIESILSQEELPDFYEEQLPLITQILSFILQTDYAVINSESDQKMLSRCRAKVVRLVQIYSFKFNSHFKSYFENFVS